MFWLVNPNYKTVSFKVQGLLQVDSVFLTGPHPWLRVARTIQNARTR